MFYEEKIINGIMHFRMTPNGEFTPYTIQELSRRYNEMKCLYNELYRRVESAPSVKRGASDV